MKFDTFNIFFKIDYFDFKNDKLLEIKESIFSQSKEYLINVDETEFIDAIYDKFHLEEVEILTNQLSYGKPNIILSYPKDRFGQTYEHKEFSFLFKIPFSGSVELLRIRPIDYFNKTINVTAIISYEALEPIINEQYIQLSQDVPKPDKKAFDETIARMKDLLTANVKNANKCVEDFNPYIKKEIQSLFQKKKAEYLKENDFFRSIELKVDDNSANIFNANPIRKKLIPLPTLDISKRKFFSSPQLTPEIYNDINSTIFNYCKSIEKKPSIYMDKDEETLRFLILSILESRYEATTATGETFNKTGKTDILLKYQDGTNLFVAECKIWRGERALLDAIDQLIGYLTWRDSKTALIIFVKVKDFSSILDKIEIIVQSHPNFFKMEENISDKSFLTCIYSFPEDSQKKFYLKVMSFHFV